MSAQKLPQSESSSVIQLQKKQRMQNSEPCSISLQMQNPQNYPNMKMRRNPVLKKIGISNKSGNLIPNRVVKYMVAHNDNSTSIMFRHLEQKHDIRLKSKFETDERKNRLGEIKRVSPTNGCWTSDQNFSYISLTAHFFEEFSILRKTKFISTDNVSTMLQIFEIFFAIFFFKFFEFFRNQRGSYPLPLDFMNMTLTIEIIKDLILNRVRSLSPTVGAATIHCGHCQYTVGDSIMRVG
ncbi:hypothetical protein BpHYR1_011871 [Brachionus plicatilis]|uniref:Uncharacterized protein n=1 Tax=Brachionus plicatilis TaxID=10195 RepID=A0A3M7SYE8_BRAPC|nr:hypothetical protein BpHYR1_011871 [Brachionus plicatilis]